MYSNNIVNFQESTTILNALYEKKSGNLLYAPRKLDEEGGNNEHSSWNQFTCFEQNQKSIKL